MKFPVLLLLCTAMLVASGCVIGSYEQYVHEPTSQIPHHPGGKQVVPKKFIPAQGEFLIVPDFTSFTSSYSTQNGYLNVFTREDRSVFIISAELEIPERNFRQVILLNVATAPKQLPQNDSIWMSRLRLFVYDPSGTKNCEFGKIRGADNLILIIRVRDRDQIVEHRFPLHIVARKSVVFVT